MKEGIGSLGANAREKAPIVLLCISHSPRLFGAERSLLDLVKGLDRERFAPIVVIPADGPLKSELDRLGIKTYIVRSPTWLYRRGNPLSFLRRACEACLLCMPSTLRLAWIARRERVDIIYTNSLVHFTGALAALATGKPHVWHVREVLTDDRGGLRFLLSNRRLFSLITRLSRLVVANSQATADQFPPEERPAIVYNGIEAGLYCGRHAGMREDGTKWRVAVIGSLQKMKAQDVAIRAIHLLRDAMPDIELLIIGEGDRKYARYLREIADGLGVRDKVVFAGFQPDIRGHLAEVEAILVPSQVESFGRVAMEAMAAGVPVIGSDVPGLREIIIDGYNGFLVSVGDPEAIAGKLRLLRGEPGLREEVVGNGRAWIKTRFSLDAYVSNMTSVLEDVSRKGGGMSAISLK